MKMMNIKTPLLAQLELTDKCNLRCLHCYRLNHRCLNNTLNNLDDESIMVLANKIVEAKIFDVVLTGGEPLLKKNLVMRLTKYFKDNDIYVSLNTNLQLLDSTILEWITSSKLDALLISCPSNDPDIYSQMTGGGDYFKFKRNLKKIIKKGLNFSVNMVVNKTNFHSIRNTACALKSLGVKKLGISPMGLNVEHPETNLFLDIQEINDVIKEIIWINENLQMKADIFEALPKCIFPKEILRKEFSFLFRKCQAGRTTLAIANNGNVRPCTHNSDIYGNLFKDSFDIIWNRMSDWRNNVFVPIECKQCKVINNCLGGCRTTARAMSDDWQAKDPWMTLPLKKISIKKNTNSLLKIRASTLIMPSKIRWREERKGFYIICTKTIRNVLLVNKELFRFVIGLQDIKSIQLCNLANECGVEINNASFQKVIELLAKKGFISIN